MTFGEFREAVKDAEQIIRSADSCAADMAKMLVGHLRQASTTYSGAEAVADLKRELRKYNIQTRKWED